MQSRILFDTHRARNRIATPSVDDVLSDRTVASLGGGDVAQEIIVARKTVEILPNSAPRSICRAGTRTRRRPGNEIVVYTRVLHARRRLYERLYEKFK